MRYSYQWRRSVRESMMEQYEELKIEVIEFDEEDVITASAIQLPLAP